jgi:hypothetical protein
MFSNEQPLDLDLKSLTEVLIRHFDIHEGIYQLNFGFRIGVGGFAMDGSPESPPLPGAMVGVEGVNILRIPDGVDLPNAVDAAKVNPVNKPKANSRSKKKI